MSPTDPKQPKKRESRSGTRKVTTLSAEQLERKRANDREAQRTIRQRTKEHIERLEHQVRELQAKGEQFDDVVRQNGALENEIKGLKQQLAMVTSRQGYSNIAEGSYSNPSGTTLPPQLSDTLSLHTVSRATSVLSTSSQVSMHERKPYSSTRSPSICESSDTDYKNRDEPFLFDRPLQAPPTIPVPSSHVAYNTPGSTHPSNPAFPPYSQFYQPASPHGEQLRHQHNPQQAMPYIPTQGAMPVPEVPPERQAGGYPVLHPQQQYPHAGDQSQRTSDYNYPWPHQP